MTIIRTALAFGLIAAASAPAFADCAGHVSAEVKTPVTTADSTGTPPAPAPDKQG